MSLFYRPTDGVAADAIPFYWEGAYHIFYLKDYRDRPQHGEGTPWFHIVTRDFVHFEDWGEAIARGEAGTQDQWIFTGSVIERDGVFHIFYTGHNDHYGHTPKPVQAIMHATSRDLRNWTKDEKFPVWFAPVEAGYEKDDWRDPLVFWNEEMGAYGMLITARKTTGPSRHRGFIALSSSADLEHWTLQEPFWEPNLYFAHECPDLFRIGQWWYLIWSEFSDASFTRYRMSRSLDGTWLAPPEDTFDGRAFYAAKAAGDNAQRFLFGWLPTREGETDSGNWQWGGNLVVHEIVQQADGVLGVRAPQGLAAQFGRIAPLSPQTMLGDWRVGEDFCSYSPSRFSLLSLVMMPEECLIECTLVMQENTASCGLVLRLSADGEKYYQVRFEMARQRFVIDQWPRPFGSAPYMVEKKLEMQIGEPIHLRAYVSGDCLVVYANDTALSCRMYDHRNGALGLFVSEGVARFSEVALKIGSGSHV